VTAGERIADLAAGLWDKPLLAAVLRLAGRTVDAEPAFVADVLDRAIADGRGKQKNEEANELLGQARAIARASIPR
jgi:hypothetical protein